MFNWRNTLFLGAFFVVVGILYFSPAGRLAPDHRPDGRGRCSSSRAWRWCSASPSSSGAPATYEDRLRSSGADGRAMDLWDQTLDLLSQVRHAACGRPCCSTSRCCCIGLVILGLRPGHRARMGSTTRALNPRACRGPCRQAPCQPGVHLPSRSIWPFVAPIGLFLVFLALAIGGGDGLVPQHPAGPRGWRSSRSSARPAGTSTPIANTTTSMRTTMGCHWPPRSRRRRHAVVIPEGVHLPGPSAWPFLAPIGLCFMFLGLVLGPLLIVARCRHGRLAARLVPRRQPGVRAGRGRAPCRARDPAIRSRSSRTGSCRCSGSRWPSPSCCTLGPWLLTFLPAAEPPSRRRRARRRPHALPVGVGRDQFRPGPDRHPGQDTGRCSRSRTSRTVYPTTWPSRTPPTTTSTCSRGGHQGLATIDYQLPPLPAGDLPVSVHHPPAHDGHAAGQGRAGPAPSVLSAHPATPGRRGGPGDRHRGLIAVVLFVPLGRHAPAGSPVRLGPVTGRRLAAAGQARAGHRRSQDLDGTTGDARGLRRPAGGRQHLGQLVHALPGRVPEARGRVR